MNVGSNFAMHAIDPSTLVLCVIFLRTQAWLFNFGYVDHKTYNIFRCIFHKKTIKRKNKHKIYKKGPYILYVFHVNL